MFAADPNCHNWVLKREKTIICPGDLEFVGFDRNCDHLITVAAKPPSVRAFRMWEMRRNWLQVESDEKVTSILRDPALVQVMRDVSWFTYFILIYCFNLFNIIILAWQRHGRQNSVLLVSNEWGSEGLVQVRREMKKRKKRGRLQTREGYLVSIQEGRYLFRIHWQSSQDYCRRRGEIQHRRSVDTSYLYFRWW